MDWGAGGWVDGQVDEWTVIGHTDRQKCSQTIDCINTVTHRDMLMLNIPSVFKISAMSMFNIASDFSQFS